MYTFVFSQQPPPPSSIPMPPLAWQNAVEDVGYISDETSPLFRSPCINGWTKPMINPSGKEEPMNFWNPIPFPKWQFHLSSESPVLGDFLNSGEKFTRIKQNNDENTRENLLTSSIKPHNNAPIFINDSPIQSGSVISISSSSDDDDEENNATNVMNTSAQSTELGLRNIEFNFTADTPSPLHDTKQNIPLYLGTRSNSLSQSHSSFSMPTCSSRKTSDSKMLVDYNSDTVAVFTGISNRMNTSACARNDQSEIKTNVNSSPPYSSLHGSRPRVSLNGYSNCHIPTVNLSTHHVSMDNGSADWDKHPRPCYHPFIPSEPHGCGRCCSGGQPAAPYDHLRFRPTHFVQCAPGLHRFPAPSMPTILPPTASAPHCDGSTVYSSFTYFSR